MFTGLWKQNCKNGPNCEQCILSKLCYTLLYTTYHSHISYNHAVHSGKLEYHSKNNKLVKQFISFNNYKTQKLRASYKDIQNRWWPWRTCGMSTIQYSTVQYITVQNLVMGNCYSIFVLPPHIIQTHLFVNPPPHF